ncbi:HalOD1 output domain-containing protein [Halobellus salinisoli]|uniref:HalOD1 output domain-containing protein n=1 Tax=Halobellus salinisoli TaxID=3108500 RepID=UPI00300814BD
MDASGQFGMEGDSEVFSAPFSPISTCLNGTVDSIPEIHNEASFDYQGEKLIRFYSASLTRVVEYEIGVNESVSAAVVRAVSAVEGREPCSLRPLACVLDTDALDALFESRANGQPRTGGCLSFVYSGCRVSIDNGEYLTLQPLESPR